MNVYLLDAVGEGILILLWLWAGQWGMAQTSEPDVKKINLHE